MSAFPPCWCGSTDSDDFGALYRRCSDCPTLISLRSAPIEHYTQVDDDEGGFYNADYWRHRVIEEHGLPDLEERSRTDLTERALAWLSWVLATRHPPAKVLELGCAHGGLVYLLGQAGFDATGLEMSPTIVAEAAERFNIRVLRGPLESTQLDERFDLILAMDVLEHLADPVQTLRCAVEHLAPGGALLLQTPCHRGEGLDWEMLLPDEHLFLFTEESARLLLNRVGLPYQVFSSGYFAYDMWILAAPERVEIPDGAPSLPALVQALLDGDVARQDLLRQKVAIDEDRQAKEELLDQLRQELAAIEEDRQAKDALIHRLSEEREAFSLEVQADRQAKDAVIERLSLELEAVRADQEARGEVIDQLDAIRQAQEAELIRLRGETS